VIETMAPLAGRKKLQISVEGEGEFKLVADPDLLERVFTNLVSNAIKFTPESGRVEIVFAEKGDEIEVSVSDSGPGVPPELAGRVFERFQQGKSMRSGGTGLGLAICRYIIESHRGSIRLESAAGRGARFIFKLPKTLSQDEEGIVLVTDGEGRGASPNGTASGAEAGREAVG
jgi:signal transduction histidine kinase